MIMNRDTVALITGGGSGIGRALAGDLARRGVRLRLADIDESGVRSTAAEIVREGGDAEGQVVDVTDRAAVASWIEGEASHLGRLDYLFNNAGIAIQGELLDHSAENWLCTLDVNLRGVVHGVLAAYPIMVRQGFGHIVNTASLAGLCPNPHLGAYVASKHAVVGLSTTLRSEGADLGVRCSVVCPGVVRTELIQNMTILKEETIPFTREELLQRMPLRPYTPERCAAAILRGVERNKPIIVVTPHAKVMWALYRISPALYLRILTLLLRRVRREMSGGGV